MDQFIVLNNLLDVIDNHNLNITENDVLNFLKIRKRWPIKYSWGQPSVEIITQFDRMSQVGFFDSDGYLIYDEWIKYYNLGFTTIISNVLDLNEELRDLQNKILEYTGTKINGNFYLSSGSSIHRVSFDSHFHDYHVILKPIYGKSKWKISEREFETTEKSFIVKSGEFHEVTECTTKKLSLTLNIL
jgi:hypothetical protein